MKILLALDQSLYSKAAVRFLQWLQLPADTELTLLHVINPPLDGQAPLLRKFSWYEQVLAKERQQVKAKVQKLLDRVQKLFQAGEMTIQCVFREGPPGENIVQVISQNRIGLAVLGSRGLTGIRRFLLGSVSEWILNSAPCSVLIVRRPLRGVRAPNPRGMRILVAADGSSDAQTALTMLQTIGLPNASEVTVLHVAEPLEEGKPHLETSIGMMDSCADFIQSPAEIIEEQEQYGMAVLNKAHQQLTGAGLKVTVLLTRGQVAEEIITKAEQLGVDVIMMGSRGLGVDKQFLLGSVSRNVVRHASCSVLVARKSGKVENG